jgi:hypothetical protein
MKTQTKVRLGFAALVLAASLGITGLSPRDAFALPCCEDGCLTTYDSCCVGWAYPECNGDLQCCKEKLSTCFNHCNSAC